MRLTTTLIAFILTSMACYAQPSDPKARYIEPEVVLSQQERYGLDYELVNYTFTSGDSTLLNGLSLDNLEYYRHDTEDVVAHDKVVGVDVLLYSRQRVLNGGTSPNEVTREN